MNRIIIIFLLFLLAVYSAALIRIDVLEGQDHVRGYFSDIVTGTDYPLPAHMLFGINTSLNVVLLSGCALLFSVCTSCPLRTKKDRKAVFFAWSQVFFFLYLAADERLMVHEKVASILMIREDALLLLVLGAVELALLYFVGEVEKRSWRVKGWLIPAGLCFAMMSFVDTFLPSEMPGRLAMEDLSKTWSSFFLLAFAWYHCVDRRGFVISESAGDG